MDKSHGHPHPRPKPHQPAPKRKRPKKPEQPKPEQPKPQPKPEQPKTQQGPHTGALVMKLPVEDLKKPKGGVWDGNVRWKKSELVTFQGEPAIRAFFKKGSGTGSMPHQESSGCSFGCENPAVKGQTAIVVAFDVFFDPDRWEWSKGGKLGGIFVGPGVASGYRHSPDGASHRIMWQREGAAISYIYPPGGLKQVDPKLQPDGHGIGYFHDILKLRKGEWNHVEIGVKINSFTNGKPNPDGISTLTVNGKTGVKRDIKWAAFPHLRINSAQFNCFFGGPDPAVVDSYAYLKNFAIHKWRD